MTMVAPANLQQLEKLVQSRGLSDSQIHAVIDRLQSQEVGENRVSHHWATKHLRIGLVSDTHFGSKYSDQGVLDDLYRHFKREGVVAVYHAGDITEGYNRRKGHSFECNLHGADEQVKGVVEHYPDIGVPTYFITGDHDSWHYENAGVDVGKAIAKDRPDLKYLGAFNATVDFAKKTSLGLLHPGTGTAYAISYKPQKIIESISGGEKPNILGVGHFHKIEYLFYRNVHSFQTGTTQSQSPWMKRMNISAHKGGWMLDAYLKGDGSIDRLDMTMFPYYA